MPRFHCPLPLTPGNSIELPANAARHVQVLRLQPGAVLTLFNGEGGEYEATVQQMGRSHVQVQVGAHNAIEREAPRAVHLLVGMPANERMDWLVEKATELGVASIQPVVAERSVLKLKGERAEKKRAHWQGIAVAACEQCGRNRVPAVHEALGWLVEWLPLHKRKARAWCCHCSPAPNPCRWRPLATTPSRCCPAPRAA
jgi:16S rRNA (uracil1498-N3)-methyltransferase